MGREKWDNDWLNFSKKARRGVIVLIGIFILVAISPRIYYHFFQPPIQYDVRYVDLSDKSSMEDSKDTQTRYTAPEDSFDPNLYTVEEWMNVGLSEKQAQSILKYINKGGEIEIKEDLKKMFVVDDELYAVLEDKINLPTTRPKQHKREGIKKEGFSTNYSDEKEKEEEVEEFKEIKPLSINTASKKELQRVKGIGPFFANEIIKLRERFGGLISPEQLLDIYNIDDEKLTAIEPFLIFDKNEVRKINVNTASKEQLKQHPWISSDMANSIVYFRENYQNYEALDELLLSPYINAKTLKRLTPYITIK